MNGQAEMVTVYRSADANAESDAARAQAHLAANGLNAVIFDDSTLGVVQGSFEVRVPAAEVPPAEALLANFDADASQVDVSPELDTVPVASMMGATAEMEALGVKSVLDAAGIQNVFVGASTLPNFEFQVRVAQADLERARAVLLEAQASGPAAAAEAELETESTGGPQA